MEKLNDYQGFSGRWHQCREHLKEKVSTLRDHTSINIFKIVDDQLKGNTTAEQDYSHIYRHKSRKELIQISAAVMGIEFSYAAETAFVSPTLLKIGVKHKHMTLVWALSPLIGFFLCPILGSMSDRCKLNMGRRRPFIILLSIGVFMGLLLVPNGEDIGFLLGDDNPHINFNSTTSQDALKNSRVPSYRSTAATDISLLNISENQNKVAHQPWAIFFTVLGTILLDFDADACQSPSRAYLLEVCPPEDHAKGLSTFTIMAGLGGFFGYSMGGIDWDTTNVGRLLGGHVKTVFTIITVIFIICVSFTVTSFKEIPLWVLTTSKSKKKATGETLMSNDVLSYGSLNEIKEPQFRKSDDDDDDDDNDEKLQPSNYFGNEDINETSFMENMPKRELLEDNVLQQPVESLSHYLLSIIYMPHSIRMVCLTNLFCWMAHVCYSLYFTDFVGEAVFKGNPTAIEGSEAQILYEDGVRFGCWGMSMYSLSCATYSFIIERLIKRFRAKKVYIGGLLFYCTGMLLMAITQTKISVILFSWTAGVMYSTLFTLPYLLVDHYHNKGIFELNSDGSEKLGATVRGLGTDIAIVSSMVFLAQFILSLSMGTIVSISGTTTAVVTTASFLSFCGAISATQVMYLDL